METYESIEERIKWLERCRVKTGEPFNSRLAYVQQEITKIDKFVNLQVNESIQSYWNPIIQSWRERLAGLFTKEQG